MSQMRSVSSPHAHLGGSGSTEVTHVGGGYMCMLIKLSDPLTLSYEHNVTVIIWGAERVTGVGGAAAMAHPKFGLDGPQCI